MRHSIISWDCSFRNFFHLIDSLAQQKYPTEKYEVIYVEQRDRQSSNNFNHQFNLQSLNDTVRQYKNKISVEAIFLDNIDTPYHLGIANNAGLKAAKGDIISVMDGDTLVSKNFLKNLDIEHEKGAKILNLFRHMVDYPLGVNNYKDWMKAHVSFSKCYRASNTYKAAIPKNYTNKGPMISARREHWEQIEGYDEALIWSTSASTLGQDVCKRLEIAAGIESTTLPNEFCVHPWHPFGYARKGRNDKKELVLKYLDLQKQLTQWSIQQGYATLSARNEHTKKLQKENLELIHLIGEEEKMDMQSGLDFNILDKQIEQPKRNLKLW